jgi:hypothetical protein
VESAERPYLGHWESTFQYTLTQVYILVLFFRYFLTMAKNQQFPDEGAMQRHEESERRWLKEQGVPARKRYVTVSRGIFCWPRRMAELCEEARLPPPAQVTVSENFLFCILCVSLKFIYVLDSLVIR